MATAKQVALEIVGALPDDCTLKDAAYRLYLRQLVEEARCVRADVAVATVSPSRPSSVVAA